MIKTLATVAAVTASVFVSGCQHDHDDRSMTAPDVTPHYEAGHYNGAVNSTGSGVGSDNPGASGGTTINGGGGSSGPMLNRGSGTSDQNGGSSSPSGATGSSSGR